MNKVILAAVAALVTLPVFAGNEDPQGSLTYSLPSTTIKLNVEAVKECFHAGPYAKYAEKFLGIKAKEKDANSCKLSALTMTPAVEADQSRRYTINAGKDRLDATSMQLNATGLISFGEVVSADKTVWRFPQKSDADFAGKAVSSSVTSSAATLYRKENNDVVSVQQNMLVAKTPEQKAKEAADMILRLRQKKYQIVTGDTDATYSGEAMAAAIEEISRLEKEYLSLFIGYSDCSTQKMEFEVIPSPNAENQMYIAFRISDVNGLLPADGVGGRPVVMEIAKGEFAQIEVDPKAKKSKAPVIYYRIPNVCNVKISEGTNLLLQTRVPIYQLGQESSMPVNVVLSK
ncbi:MAG: DUF4831 family protein [Candidatus Cryptobacteroides sp.]